MSALQNRKPEHGLPSPPVSDPTPEREERERSRSVSVALMSIIPASLREHFAVKPMKIKGVLDLVNILFILALTALQRKMKHQ